MIVDVLNRTNVHFLVFHLTIADAIICFVTMPMETIWRYIDEVASRKIMIFWHIWYGREESFNCIDVSCTQKGFNSKICFWIFPYLDIERVRYLQSWIFPFLMTYSTWGAKEIIHVQDFKRKQLFTAIKLGWSAIWALGNFQRKPTIQMWLMKSMRNWEIPSGN